MNKTQAAKFLNISVRTLQRYMAQHKISFRFLKSKTGEEAVFDKAELKRFKDELKAQRETATVRPAIAPAGAVSPRTDRGESTALMPAGLVQTFDRLATTWERLLSGDSFVPAEGPKPTVRVAEKLSLSLREASALSGYSKAFLIKAIHEGKLKAAKGRTRGWNIKRSDLESYIAKL